MFVLALSSKEIALTLPLVVLAYDLIYHGIPPDRVTDLGKRHLPFWIILVSFLGMRLWLVRRIGYSSLRFRVDALWAWLDGMLRAALNPFCDDVDPGTRWLFLGTLALIMLLYRSRREVVFGLVWIPATYMATFNSLTGPSDRSFYVASLGLTLVVASILMHPLDRWIAVPRASGLVVLVAFIISYGNGLVTRNQLYYRAGEVAQAIPQQVQTFYPSLPQDARLVFVGVPDQLPSGVLIYMTGLQASMQLTYKDQSLRVFKLDGFPDHVDEPERTFFFLVDHRKVFDRTGAMRALLSK
jgi:hypothetical protein